MVKRLSLRCLAMILVTLSSLILLGMLLRGEALAGENGRSVRFVFRGNVHLSDKDLQGGTAEELAGFADTDFPEAKADDAAFLIGIIYRKAGYAFVKVTYDISSDSDGLVVSFLIVEGPQVLVNSISISGNRAFTEKQIQAFFDGQNSMLGGDGTFIFVESSIDDAVAAIRDLYTGEGFLQAKIGEPEFVFSADLTRVKVRLHIEEGPRVTVGEIRFHGDVLPEADKELSKLAADLRGKPFLARRKLLLRSGVQEIYGNLGYPDIKVEIGESRNESASTVELDCSIKSGPMVRIGGIKITGNKRTDIGFIKNRLVLRQGEAYSSRKKRESFERLYETGLFSKVSIALAEEGSNINERLLLVQVEETMAREVFFEGGWGSYEMLRGSMGFLDKNFFGTGRVFRTEVGGSFKSADVETSLRDPWFLNTDISADLPVFFRYREEPSFTTEELGASLLFSKDLSKDLSVSLAYLYSSTQTTDIAAMDVEETENDYTTASIKLQTTLDTRNDLIFPTNGKRIFASAEVAEPSLGSDISFYRFNLGLRHFYPVGKSNTLALRYATGIILPGRNQVTIPIGERFFNGGENTVRSFFESELGPKDSSGDPLGGMAYNVISVELRHLLTDRLVISFFFDYGNVSPNLSPEEDSNGPFTDRQDVIDRTLHDYFSDFRPGLGAGFQYLLPVGPARVDFAWNPDRDKERDEDSFAVHLSIGMAF